MNTTTATTRPNRYPATCAKCGGHVPAGEGRLVSRTRGGRWTVVHVGGVCGRTGNLVVPSSATSGLSNSQRAHAAAMGIDTSTGTFSNAPYRYAGMTWAEVDEANEYFDGETEIRAAARAEWERRSGMFCPRHGDSHAHGDTSCWECSAEAEEAVRDRLDGYR